MSRNTEKVKQILDQINETQFTASEYLDIFCALVSRNEALSGKLVTTDGMRSILNDNYKNEVSNKYSGIKIHVTDIIWDIEKNDFDNESEYHAVIDKLPTSIDIPLSALKKNVDVIDYLRDKYGYCISAYCTEEYSNIIF